MLSIQLILHAAQHRIAARMALIMLASIPMWICTPIPAQEPPSMPTNNERMHSRVSCDPEPGPSSPDHNITSAAEEWKDSIADHELELLRHTPLAMKMVKTYRAIQTYQARWATRKTDVVLGSRGKEFSVGFDRNTRNTLFFYYEYLNATKIESYLLIKNGGSLVIARPDLDKFRMPSIDVQRKPEPGPFRYRDFEKHNTSTWTPWDLALLWSPTPMADVLGGEVGDLETMEADASGRPGVKIVGRHGKEFVVLRLDPKEYIVQKKVYVNTMEFDLRDADPIVLKKLDTNGPIEAGVFDPDNYLRQLRSDKE